MPVLDARHLDDAGPDALRALDAMLRVEGAARPKPRGWFTAPREIGGVPGHSAGRGGRRPVRRAVSFA